MTAPELQEISDVMDPARAAALHAVLDRPGKPPGPADPLPPFWHQVYFWQVLPPALLGPDGHPALGQGLIPDLGPRQRMWAGGELSFDHPVILGRPALRRSRLEDIQQKTGRSGPLTFVTLIHEIVQDGRVCVTERQDIVYRGPLPAGRKAKPAPGKAQVRRRVAFDPILLFQYSGLTMNGHRIHYDQDHATRVEGYGGLVVHGPLLAQLLIHLAEEELGPLRRFGFRAASPLVHTETAQLCRQDDTLWVAGPGGRLVMQAWAAS